MFTISTLRAGVRPPSALTHLPQTGWLPHPRTRGGLVHGRQISKLTPFNRVVQAYPDYQGEKVPSRELLERLRGSFLRQKMENDSKQAYFAEAYEAVALLTAAPARRDSVALGEIREVVSDWNSFAWATVLDLLRGLPDPSTQMTEEQRAACQFLRLYGVGQVKATKLAKYGIRTLEDLRAADTNVLSTGAKLSLEHLADMDTMIPRKEMDVYKETLDGVFHGQNPVEGGLFEMVGAYRRGEDYSPSIDVLVWSDSYQNLSQSTSVLDDAYKGLVRCGLLSKDKVLSSWRTKNRRRVLGYVRSHPSGPWRLLKLSVVPRPHLPFEMIAATGDGFLYRLLRTQAKLRGYRLHQNKISWLVDQKASLDQPTTEEEVFKMIGVPYLQPHQRSYRVFKDLLPSEILERTSEPWDNAFMSRAGRSRSPKQQALPEQPVQER